MEKQNKIILVVLILILLFAGIIFYTDISVRRSQIEYCENKGFETTQTISGTKCIIQGELFSVYELKEIQRENILRGLSK